MLQTKRLTFRSHSSGLLLIVVVLLIGLEKGNAQKPVHSGTVVRHQLAHQQSETDSSAKFYRRSLQAELNKNLHEPLVRMNPNAIKFVDNYLKKSNEELVMVKKRSGDYFKTIESILLKYHVPVQLKYLAVIESQLKTSAVSHAGAVGMWQMMPQTARSLGLKVTTKYDERKHFVKSTTAAAAYIKSLYAQFDDWLLVIAAYNSGAGTVSKAIKKSGSRDFWVIQQYLPAETKAHVKRYIGAHYFFENKGSAATLTKSEVLKYRKSLSDYEEGLKVLEEIKQQNAEVSDVLPKTAIAEIKTEKSE